VLEFYRNYFGCVTTSEKSMIPTDKRLGGIHRTLKIIAAAKNRTLFMSMG
jgi:hypothetical protein